MILYIYLLSAAGLLICAKAQILATNSTARIDILDYVDLFIGSRQGGNTFIGASRPYGLAKAVADCTGDTGGNTAGFTTDGSPVTGFSGMHDAGTGGEPSLGNFPLFPELCPGDDINNCVYSKADRAISVDNSSIIARPGYFSLTMRNGIKAEMAVGERAALYEFTYPNTATSSQGIYGNSSLGAAAAVNGEGNISPLVLIDLTDLQDSRSHAAINIDERSGRMTGNGTFKPSFGLGTYSLFFCADFASSTGMRDNGLHINTRADTQPKQIQLNEGINAFYYQAGGWIRFLPDNSSNQTVISVRQGLSYISSEQACANMERDIPDSSKTGLTRWSLPALVNETQDLWRQKLAPVTITPGPGVGKDYLTLFYSAVYRTMLNPQNYTGENPLWQSSEPYFDSLYAIWDEFRAQFPFLTIVDPKAMSEIVRGLLNIQQHLGWLPDSRMSTDKGFTQGGSNADVVLADAYAKNLSTEIDFHAALEAVLKDAEQEPFDWGVNGRGGLVSWHSLGYIPYLDYDYLGFGVIAHSISRTLEYAYNDYCVGMLGKGLGLSNYTTYLQRSFNFQNIFKADQRASLFGVDTGFVGYYQPKFQNGTWGYQDPVACATVTGTFCSLTSNPSETFESSIWEYTFFVPHAFGTLISMLGGADLFNKRLDYFYTSGLLDISNEPSFLSVYAYHYSGRPALSAERVHSFIPSMFNTTYGGLPGNDDSGAMAAWTLFGLLGLFPNAGQNVYLIIPSFFKEVSIKSPKTGKTATVRNINFDSTYKAIYIQSATLNGKPYTKNWIGHEFFDQGMILELTLATKESSWGQSAQDLPPSLSEM